jgi:voltage-gated potassium channel
MAIPSPHRPDTPWRRRLHEIIVEADTPAGKAFDVILIWSIVCSVAAALLESVGSIRAAYGGVLSGIEWGFTVLFTVEYGLRLLSATHPWRYMTSFFGVVDVLAVVPTYLSVVLPGGQYFLTVRILRLLRIFRILKLSAYLAEADVLLRALRESRRKISVFLLGVLTAVVIMGALMYVIEGEAHGFTSIPISIYWAIVTMTTVGYGDLSPQTALGKALASCVMIIGYAIIAVPTGIVTVEMSNAMRRRVSTRACPRCGAKGHAPDARYCQDCGARLDVAEC